MKRFHVHLTIAVFLVTFAAYGQTNIYGQVSQLWVSGQKQAVLDIAQQRLEQNTNDIAGLILKLEYEVAFLDITNLTTTATRVITVGSGITTSNFLVQFTILQSDYTIITNTLAEYTSEELAMDRQKGNIAGKPMSFGAAIKALQDDGYFQ